MDLEEITPKCGCAFQNTDTSPKHRPEDGFPYSLKVVE